jgi:glycosyltransferase involved in cell wall biosynthesis
VNDTVGEVPFVSVVVPIRNEAAFIADLVSSILRQDYPADRMEVIVADGMSEDGTGEILRTLQDRDARLVVVNNPGRIVSTGLNAATERARGEIIIRIDGHAVIAPDFIRQNVLLLQEHPEAWSVGGPIRHVGKTRFGQAAALAMSHPLGVGNASHRFADYEGYAEGAAFPAIRRWVFNRIGLFDERLVRNQDDEFNYRIQRAGGLVYISPRVRYSYFVRSRPGQLFRQYFQYAFWRIPVIEKHRRPTTWRQLVPTLFLSTCAVLGVVAALRGSIVVGVALPALYGAGLLLAAVGIARRASLSTVIQVPVAMATMHVAYGLGMGYGLWARLCHRDAWNIRGSMSTITR